MISLDPISGPENLRPRVQELVIREDDDITFSIPLGVSIVSLEVFNEYHVRGSNCLFF